MWLTVAGRGRRDPNPPEPERWPGVTAVVPAYRESKLIEAKIDDLRANGYPGGLAIIVVADDPDTAAAARKTKATVIESEQRLGKSEALNRGLAEAPGPVVVITDANTRLESGSLASLARWFEDPVVGAVAGEKRVAGAAQGAYWRFESWLKRRESRLGSTIGLVGELAALRRSCWRPLPRDVAADDLWIALDVIEQGAEIRYEPQAIATEHPSASFAEEWERRTRVVCGVLDVLSRRRRLLLPSTGGVAMQLWGHRLVRSSLGPLAHLVLLAGSVGSCRRRHLSRVFLLTHLFAALSLARQHAGAAVSTPERFGAQLLFLQGVALGGLARFLRGDRPAVWPKARRREGLPGAARSI